MKPLFAVVSFFLLFGAALASDISGVQCEADGDCAVVVGSTCNLSLNLCECSGNSVLDSTMQKCLAVGWGAGAICEEDVQCSTVLLNGGTCNNGKCGCALGMHYLKGRCWPSRALGETCSTKEECSGILEVNAVSCVEGKCACADAFYQREYTDCRKKVLNVGEACSLDSDCQFEGGYCNEAENVCENISGRTPIARIQNKGEKIPNRTKTASKTAVKQVGSKALGDECSEAPECGVPNSDCSPSGYCMCARGFFAPAGEQNCVPEIGGPCSSNEECSAISGASCDADVCVCAMGTAAAANKQECLKQIYDYRYQCNETSQCTLFGARVLCRDQGSKVCTCDDFSREIKDDHICWIIKGPGDECADLRDCSAVSGDHLITCSDNKTCDCVNGYHSSADAKDCFLNAPDLNDVCVEDGDCEVEFSICDSKSKQCKCKTGYYPEDNVCLVGVGGPCLAEEDCASAADSVCTEQNKKCECPAGWIANLATSACLLSGSGVNSTCVESQQCVGALGTLSECSDGLCQCKKRHHLVEGVCTPSKGLGEECSKSYECFPPVSVEGVICRNNKCSCDYGLVPAQNNAYCTSSAVVAKSVAPLLLLLVGLLHFLRPCST